MEATNKKTSLEHLQGMAAFIQNSYKEFGFTLEPISKLAMAIKSINNESINNLRGHFQAEYISEIKKEFGRISEIVDFKHAEGSEPKVIYALTLTSGEKVFRNFQFVVPGNLILDPVFKNLKEAQKVLDHFKSVKIPTPYSNMYDSQSEEIEKHDNMQFEIAQIMRPNKT